jgi:hypothetical protein
VYIRLQYVQDEVRGCFGKKIMENVQKMLRELNMKK